MMNLILYRQYPIYYEYRNKQFEVIYSPEPKRNFGKFENGKPNPIWKSWLDDKYTRKQMKFLPRKRFYERIEREKALVGKSDIYFKFKYDDAIYRLHYKTLDGYYLCEIVTSVRGYYPVGKRFWYQSFDKTNIIADSLEELKAGLL